MGLFAPDGIEQQLSSAICKQIERKKIQDSRKLGAADAGAIGCIVQDAEACTAQYEDSLELSPAHVDAGRSRERWIPSGIPIPISPYADTRTEATFIHQCPLGGRGTTCDGGAEPWILGSMFTVTSKHQLLRATPPGTTAC